MTDLSPFPDDLAGQGARSVDIAPSAPIVWGVREFEGKHVLTATVDGVLYYEGPGFCRITEHQNASDAIAAHVGPHQKVKLDVSAAHATLGQPDSGVTRENVGPNPYRWFITKQGANRLVMESRVPGAVRIKQWLADDVMTAIEETGSYVAPGHAAPFAMPSLKSLNPEDLAFLGQVGQALAQTSEALLAERALTARQARELEAAQSKADYVDSFVDPAEDNTLFRTFCGQIDAPERKLREYLKARGVIYRKLAGRRWSRSKKAWEDVHQYYAHAAYKAWFHPVDQVDAPRLHNGQLQTTLYVTPVGKVGIKRLLERNPIEGAA